LFRTLRRALPILILPFLLGLLVAATSATAAPEKTTVVDMHDFFLRGNPLSSYPSMPNAATVETTIRNQVFFSDLEGNNSGWSVVNYRQGQPNAWHIVTGSHACVGSSWWCGATGFLHGDGYDNNWVQSLKTVTPINLAGSSNNKLTFKYKVQTEYGYDWLWVLIKGSDPGAHYDTLASFSGNFGGSCANASVAVPDSFTTVTQPVELRFLFGSDLTISTADTTGTYTGATLDDVKITAQGNLTKFFDDMESGSSKWLAESPNPGTLWHVENAPGTSIPATCFFLSTNVWVPFSGTGFGLLPDFCDAMLVSPPMSLERVFSPNTPGHPLRLQFDDWVNLPPDNAIFWSLYVSGSDDLATWTPWRNPFGGLIFSGGNPQCTESQQDYKDFDPWATTVTGIQPGTKYLRLGFRVRDEKATYEDGGPLRINYNTEGIYFDNIGVYHIYSISGVETVSAAPVGSRAEIRKVYPNPFNPHTTIEFSVPHAGPVAVRVFDLHGKEVATLVNTPMSPGVYRARWDGRDTRGGDVASGMYFASVQSRGTRDTARLMLLK
jgi:FlgD Ig-like domain